MELAKRDGPSATYPGSPASQGQLQFDLWGVTPKSGRWDWAYVYSNSKLDPIFLTFNFCSNF